MTDTSPSQLSKLQWDIILVLAEIDSDFFLTGGAVLAGWILKHRKTDDMDIFTEHDSAIASAQQTARYIAHRLGCTFEAIQSTPDFYRCLLSKKNESVQIDFVRDRAPQLFPKVVRSGIRTDSVEEIITNKLCALAGRNEIRDLVDLMYLEKAGYRVENFLDAAHNKDTGVTPAILAWLLSRYSIPDKIPGDVPREQLVQFARDLESRMRNAARPQ